MKSEPVEGVVLMKGSFIYLLEFNKIEFVLLIIRSDGWLLPSQPMIFDTTIVIIPYKKSIKKLNNF